jgi:hypothetical protein
MTAPMAAWMMVPGRPRPIWMPRRGSSQPEVFQTEAEELAAVDDQAFAELLAVADVASQPPHRHRLDLSGRAPLRREGVARQLLHRLNALLRGHWDLFLLSPGDVGACPRFASSVGSSMPASKSLALKVLAPCMVRLDAWIRHDPTNHDPYAAVVTLDGPGGRAAVAAITKERPTTRRRHELQ